MTSTVDWPALRAAFAQAEADYRANATLPAGAPLTGAQVASLLVWAQPYLAALPPFFAAHSGVLTGAVDILTALAKQGAPGAAKIANVVAAIPGAVVMANDVMPFVIGVLQATAPAAVGIDPPTLAGGERIGRG